MHLIKTSEEPFYCFLSGGAGVGKSHVTKALYQAGLKYYNSKPGLDCIHPSPYWKAAIPASQSLRNYNSLDSIRLKTIRCQLGRIKQSRKRLH